MREGIPQAAEPLVVRQLPKGRQIDKTPDVVFTTSGVLYDRVLLLEAAPGFEPGWRALQAPA